MPTKLFVANWKMNKSFSESRDFCVSHKSDLKKISTHASIEIVLCPSFPALDSVRKLLSDTAIHLGSQTCSPHPNGAYTGQVSAQSLKEVGCNYCIVGHSEQRAFAGVTDEDVAHAAKNLCEQKIEPIICIGENKEQFEKKETLRFLEQQLDPVIAALKTTTQQITIAYEPIWAIGSGETADADYLTKIVKHVSTILSQTHAGPWRIIYGGSVSVETIRSFADIPSLAGFLIGGASLDFQKFEKIVSLGK